MPIDENFTIFDDAWAAGFFDGEGTLLTSRHSERPRNFKPQLTVCQVDRRPLEKLQAMYGGAIGFQHNRRPNQRDHWRWVLSSGIAIREVLPRWMPYLIVKREQAQIMLALCNLIQVKGGGKYRPISPANLRERERLHDLLIATRRGVGTHSD